MLLQYVVKDKGSKRNTKQFVIIFCFDTQNIFDNQTIKKDEICALYTMFNLLALKINSDLFCIWIKIDFTYSFWYEYLPMF